MPRKKKRAKAEETPEGVEVTVVYPDRKLPPPLPPRPRARHCPKCGEGPVGHRQRYATSPDAYLFECGVCVDPETCRPTRWREPRG